MPVVCIEHESEKRQIGLTCDDTLHLKMNDNIDYVIMFIYMRMRHVRMYSNSSILDCTPNLLNKTITSTFIVSIVV